MDSTQKQIMADINKIQQNAYNFSGLSENGVRESYIKELPEKKKRLTKIAETLASSEGAKAYVKPTNKDIEVARAMSKQGNKNVARGYDEYGNRVYGPKKKSTTATVLRNMYLNKQTGR